MTAASSAVRIDRRDGVGEIVLARPDRRNALDYAAVLELVDALEQLEADDAIRAVLLYGEGRSFCAGGDLAEFRSALGTAAYDFHRSGAGWADLMLLIPRMSKPVVVAAHGHALAGGCGIVAAADVAIAAEGTVFGTSEITIGLFPIIVYPTLVKAVGGRAAREMALTGRRVEADEACRLGLVHRVVPADAHLADSEDGRRRPRRFGPARPRPRQVVHARGRRALRRAGDCAGPGGAGIVHDQPGLRRGTGRLRREAPAELRVRSTSLTDAATVPQSEVHRSCACSSGDALYDSWPSRQT